MQGDDMASRELESELLGREVRFNYSEHWVGYALLGLRLVMGWTFFYAGATKVWDPTWSVRSFLLYAVPDGNPFTSFWAMLANDWAWLLTPLNSLGLTLIGLALLTGTLVRFSAFWGALMMLFYWAAYLPLEHAAVVDYHIVYVLLLFGLGAFGAGRILGIDAWLESQPFVEDRPRLKLLLG
jgi:thiosulfate dehydrogenase [quinone] large subunit